MLKTWRREPSTRGRWVLSLTGLLAALLAGCHTARGPRLDTSRRALAADALLVSVTDSNRLDPEWLRATTNLFTLGPGDRVEIEVVGDETTRTTALVGPDGRIYYHLLPGLDVLGLTLPQTKDLLERELTQYIREAPKVALTLRAVESKRVWLLGRLATPGVYAMTNGPMTLLEAISQAGGPATAGVAASVGGGALTLNLAGVTEEAADLRRSFVIRHGQLLPVDFQRLLKEGDLSQNIYLQADDFVYLPSAVGGDVYVLGAVAQPRSVPFGGQMTLVTALAAANGSIKDAYLSHVAIVRGSLAEPKIAIVDLKNIIRGGGPDILLEPRDIVYVPFTPYRTLTRYLELIANTFVRTVAANEGARAVVRGAQPIGVNVPVGF
jgi:polysaccharide biosynthesis/export protein